MILEELTTPAASELPIRDFAEHLRLGSGFSDDGSEDTVLEMYLRSAMAQIEARIGKALIRRSFSWSISRWFAQEGQSLPISPVRDITSVTVFKASGDSQLLSTTLYRLEVDLQRSKLVMLGASLPAIPTGGSAIVAFEAGFGTWDEIPADLKQAVLLLAASYYENRAGEGRMDGVPSGVSALLEKYRPIRIGGER